jgi:hypothetical protein
VTGVEARFVARAQALGAARVAVLAGDDLCAIWAAAFPAGYDGWEGCARLRVFLLQPAPGGAGQPPSRVQGPAANTLVWCAARGQGAEPW